MGLFGTIFNGLVGMYGADRSASAQEYGARMSYEASKKRDISENMRNAMNLENKATKDLMDQGTRNVQMQQQSFSDVMGVLRDAYMRQSGIGKRG